MQRYRFPGYEMHLLAALQRQQHSAVLCDTLLQTEGISVPAHSCVLAAFSPYLSQKLSAAPPPPFGQQRQLQLQAVKAQTLLKLVSLFYSGVLEVKESVEQRDVLAAARQFGIAGLVGQRDEPSRAERLREASVKRCREGGVLEKSSAETDGVRKRAVQREEEVAGRKGRDSPLGRRSVSASTRNVQAGEELEGSPFVPPAQTKVLIRRPDAAAAGGFGGSGPQNKTAEGLGSAPCPPIPSGGLSTSDRLSQSLTNPSSMSDLSSDVAAVSDCHSDNSASHRPREGRAYQQPLALEDRAKVPAEEKTGVGGGNTEDEKVENGDGTQQSSHTEENETLIEEKGNPAEKRRTSGKVGMKNLSKMRRLQQMATPLSVQAGDGSCSRELVKVKLRRRTTGKKMWEVVNLEDREKGSLLPTSVKRHNPNLRRRRGNPPNTRPPLFAAEPRQNLPHAAVVRSREPPHRLSAACQSQPLAADRRAPVQACDLESAAPPQPPGPAEESDEQIEKLLEDIMMGMDILPTVNFADCKTSHRCQPNGDGVPTPCQGPLTEGDAGRGAVAAGCACCHGYATPNEDALNDAGILCCTSAHSHLSCTNASSQPDCKGCLHQCLSAMGQRDGTSHDGMFKLTDAQTYWHPMEPNTPLAVSTPCYSGAQIHYPKCKGSATQGQWQIPEFLPQSSRNEALSLPCPVMCMDDVRLPRCLSPLEPCTSAALHHPVLSNSRALAPLQGQAGLMEALGMLQFPLGCIGHRESQETNYGSQEKPCQERLDLNPKDGESCVGVEERGSTSAGSENTAELKCDRAKGGVGVRASDATAPPSRKGKRANYPLDVSGSLLPDAAVKVGERRKREINLNCCSVSLSSNNVLAKKREAASSSANTPPNRAGKPSQPLPVPVRQTQKSRRPGELADQTRIRTRGFLKNTREEMQSSTSPAGPSGPNPASIDAKIVPKKIQVLSRKRGRPPKIKIEELPPSKSVHGAEREEQTVLEKEKKRRKRSEKRLRERSREGDSVPRKHSVPAHSSDKAEKHNDGDLLQASSKLHKASRNRKVSLQDFQKLINRQHLKTRKSKEKKDQEPAERERKECSRRDALLSMQETETDGAQDTSGAEVSNAVLSITVDMDHVEVSHKAADRCSSQTDDWNGSLSRERGVFAGEGFPVFSFDALEEDVNKLAGERRAETEPPLDNNDRVTACGAGVAVASQSAAGCESSPRTDGPLQGNAEASNRDPTPPPDAKGPGVSSGGEQGDNEVEVDVVLYSPGKETGACHCEVTPRSTEVTPDEDEEDVNVTDLTGDEAE